MPRRPRNRAAERAAATDAFELAKGKDLSLERVVDGEVIYLPVEDEVLTTSERLRARKPQPVTTYRVCETCGGRRRRPAGIRSLEMALPDEVPCLTCQGEGRVPVETRDMTTAELALHEDLRCD